MNPADVAAVALELDDVADELALLGAQCALLLDDIAEHSD